MNRRIQHQRGFTLVEILMAVALGGLILVSASAFLMGVFNLSLIAEREPLFEEHVDSTTRFLEYAFSTALPVPEGAVNEEVQGTNNQRNTNNQSNSGDDSRPKISWQRIPGEIGLNPEALSFRLPGDIPIFVAEDSYLPEVSCYLVFKDGEGLLLRWRTDEMASEDDDETLTSVISPYVTELIYYYYDREDDKWEDSDEAEQSDEGETMMPDFIGLSFVYPDGREAKRQVLLPAVDSERPLP
ncbi:PulJ/GspJ family protein [Rubellicoccus peritrichatus]|uniref:Prepilin-type N-terminal cleavage/methylation domain-containing protein n=1 Tax=Rubellicoccus peritrichatus TaxID=3080537 RepID=A0AAQ3QUR1_9BACT|nr:prepilin-type N-terminal cleavage/methylation domain-containing protein [Puniceicoccus sp. CR14]WOO40037.1 prepilin-type N-terminal cleavage/methylation domain-containing protein [Puniceicoccus sp. CR14]